MPCFPEGSHEEDWIACAVAVLACLPARSAFAASCDSLAKVALKDTAITKAEVVPPALRGARRRRRRGPNPYQALGEFCRVAATLTPTSDSDIKIEVWLPAERLERQVPGGRQRRLGGVISYSDMAEALQSGYATASTDTGHVGGRGTFALGHPEKLVDFAWRSEHEMTAKAKLLIAAFYGSGPKRLVLERLFDRRTPGAQGRADVPRGLRRDHRRRAGESHRDAALDRGCGAEGSGPLHSAGQVSGHPPGRARGVRRGDGLKDGLIDDPRQCRFDPAVLLCKAGDGPSCLTAPQVAAAKQIYSNAVNPRTKQELFASLVPAPNSDGARRPPGPSRRR